MKHIAHISFHGGGLVLPAQTPYERELLMDHIEFAAKGKASIELDLDGRQWTVSSNSRRQEVCTSCDRQPGQLSFQRGIQILCGQCARRVLQ
jgi:hypothetical protein